jgi:hypothetical protein
VTIGRLRCNLEHPGPCARALSKATRTAKSLSEMDYLKEDCCSPQPVTCNPGGQVRCSLVVRQRYAVVCSAHLDIPLVEPGGILVRVVLNGGVAVMDRLWVASQRLRGNNRA